MEVEEDASMRAQKRVRGDGGKEVDTAAGTAGDTPGSSEVVVPTLTSEAFYSRLTAVEERAARFSKQSGDLSHPFAFAFVEGLLVKVRVLAGAVPGTVFPWNIGLIP
jgi:hypothetical protein